MSVPEPVTAVGREALAVLLKAPEHALLCCDFDGTLAPIVVRPEQADADPEAVAALGAVAGLLGTTVVLTGRPALVAVRLGRLDAVPRLRVLGHYGLESWYDGRLAAPAADPAVARARARLIPLLPVGATVEDKGLSFAVHTRTAVAPDEALAQLDAPLRAVAAEEGLEVVSGSLTLEVRPGGVDKGTTLRALAERTRPSAVVLLGDDDGDLPAADAVQALRGDGVPGLVLCAQRQGGSARLLERADVVVDGVTGVAAWLRWLEVRVLTRR